MQNYYVYQYLREDNTPYYIGKGKDDRAWEQHRRNGKGVYTPTDRSKIIILEQNLTDSRAKDLEIELIAKYGRKDLGTGILRNRTDGGEGTSKTVVSEETKAKMSAARIGRKLSDETKAKMSAVRKGRSNGREGTKHSIETIEKMRATHNTNYKSQELRDRIAKTMTEIWATRKSDQLANH
jgi:hypothetical protein